MRGVEVQGTGEEGRKAKPSGAARGPEAPGEPSDAPGGGPTEAARKRAAVELVKIHDQQLRWTARRYSICREDAEDACQRGIEILLSKAPSTEMRHLLPWARTVIKHEALSIRKTRERTLSRNGSAREEHPDEDWVQLIPAAGDGPDQLAVRRERIARSREALALLKPAELKALTQLAEGFSYAEIGHLNDWTRTKVNRCLAEGRARFRSAFRESETGERCVAFEPLLSALCDGELTGPQQRELENHLAVCGHCRSTLRAYRAAPAAAAALVPVLPAGPTLWEKAQEIFLHAQMKLQGLGRGAESGVQGAIASGGTSGAGVVAAAKIAAICAGTAGTAAVCVATGVIPDAGLLPRKAERPAIERPADLPPPAPPREESGIAEPRPAIEPAPEPAEKPAVEPVATEPPPEAPRAPVPAPTPTETEFTPESAGVPVAVPPPPPQPAPSPVPLGSGGGEFAP